MEDLRECYYWRRRCQGKAKSCVILRLTFHEAKDFARSQGTGGLDRLDPAPAVSARLEHPN